MFAKVETIITHDRLFNMLMKHIGDRKPDYTDIAVFTRETIADGWEEERHQIEEVLGISEKNYKGTAGRIAAQFLKDVIEGRIER